MTRCRLAALVIPLAAVSCNKAEPATVPPADATASTDPAPQSDAGYPAPPADAGAVAPTEPDRTTPDAGDAADEPPPDGGTPVAAGDPASPSNPVAPPPKDDPPATADAEFKLPKPIHASVKASCGKDPGVGQKLKSFKLPRTEEGKTYSNGSFRGRVMLVNFWGTWCKPCLKELPKFAQLYRRYRKHGMTLLAIATDEDAEAVKDTLAAKKIRAKVAIAGEAYAGKYESPDFPFTFVVDHKGTIVGSYFGYEPECMGKLEADIRAQLEKRAAAKK